MLAKKCVTITVDIGTQASVINAQINQVKTSKYDMSLLFLKVY